MLGTWGNAAGIYPIRMVLICTVSGVSIHQYTHHGLCPQFFFFGFWGGAGLRVATGCGEGAAAGRSGRRVR